MAHWVKQKNHVSITLITTGKTEISRNVCSMLRFSFKMRHILVRMREKQFVWADMELVLPYNTGPSFECYLLR